MLNPITDQGQNNTEQKNNTGQLHNTQREIMNSNSECLILKNTYKIGYIHNVVLSRMCTVNSKLKGNLFLLTLASEGLFLGGRPFRLLRDGLKNERFTILKSFSRKNSLSSKGSMCQPLKQCVCRLFVIRRNLRNRFENTDIIVSLLILKVQAFVHS